MYIMQTNSDDKHGARHGKVCVCTRVRVCLLHESPDVFVHAEPEQRSWCELTWMKINSRRGGHVVEV